MVFNNNLLLGAAGQSGVFDTTLIERSAWFDGAADYMARQNGAAFANNQEAIFSFWVLRTKLDTQQAFFGSLEDSYGFLLQFENTNKLWIYQYPSYNQITTAVYRDIGWYHILVSFDTSQATASDRVKLWVNGEQVTNFSTATYNPQNTKILGLTGLMTGAETMRIGNYTAGAGDFYFWNGYVAQACMLESVSIQQGDYAVSDFLDNYTFGDNGSQYVPRADADVAALATAAGGNSFCLTTAIGDGTDASGNGNNFTPTSMSDAANGSANTPSNQHVLLNPLASNGTVSNGAQVWTGSGVGAAPCTIYAPPNSGSYYAKCTINPVGSDSGSLPGVVGSGFYYSSPDMRYPGDTATGLVSIGYYGPNGNKIISGGSYAYGSTFTTGDEIGIKIDTDNGEVTFYKNGTSQGAISYDNTVPVTFSSGYGSVVGSTTQTWDFAATPPADEKTLNTANLPTPAYQGADYFTVTLAQEADIEADVASAVADWSSNVTLYKNLAVAESWIHRFSSDASNEYLTGDNTSPTYQSTSTLAGTNAWVAFSFRTEDQAYQQTGISHTNGAVTTVTHNLGNADAMILLYNRSGTGNIFFYAPQLTAGKLLKLNTNAAEAVDTSIQNVLANSFDIGSTQATGTYDVFILLNGDVFGVTSYIGNGAIDGAFLSLSFKPQFMYLRGINPPNDGSFFDTTRDDTGNVTNDALFINLNDAEYPNLSTYNQDFLSGGWKARNSVPSFNGVSYKYFVLAVADIAGGGDLPPIYGR